MKSASKHSKENAGGPAGRVGCRGQLAGLGWLIYCAAFAWLGLGLNRLAVDAAPVPGPDLSTCGPPNLPNGVQPTDCCPPYTSTVVDFKLPSPTEQLRVRPAAHLVDADYLAMYKKAVELMKALPDDDPRSFKQQANVHCAYCNGAYDQLGFPGLELDVHNSWLFFPFHRFYLYFNERILRKLICNDTFALPFWNWDAPGGMQIPSIYTDTSSPLYDNLRNANYQPPALLSLDFSGTKPPAQQIQNNLQVMKREMITGGTTAQLFLGAAYRAGDQPDPGAGTVERESHSSVHWLTGDPTHRHEDMGAFYSAGRDPIFFAHHGNIDRLWYLWRGLGSTHQDFTDPDWLNSTFLFYDENAQLVRVRVQDCLDTDALRYTYQDVDIPWNNVTATPAKPPPTLLPPPKIPQITFPLALDSPTSAIVVRPEIGIGGATEEEVLVVEGVQMGNDQLVKFDVFINAPNFYQELGPSASQCAGSFIELPEPSKNGRSTGMDTTVRFGITELLNQIGAASDKTITVTLVPRNGTVSIGGLKVEFSLPSMI
ncbi:polyphenol oxidase, chloroplastic-like [Ananas comosus]|uniref:Polyphenol oxidase, chloroplastic n=1 Tax=Ananas comosus TaxID=4615 RepID=A0A199VCW6_ANACO|nr:polyphenol oxidase, chloroplastic-like [Ananas comosus]OAY74939.1 Polyphenol oxidase, chloroplastic [Ananas comosus]